MGIYLDTSCVWKLLLPENGSAAVQAWVEKENEVIISGLAELEIEQQLLQCRKGGSLTATKYRLLVQKLADFRRMEPFSHPLATSDVFSIGRRQIRSAGAYCRTLDRLHLAMMEALGVRRLLTNDGAQSAAAKSLGYSVLMPRGD